MRYQNILFVGIVLILLISLAYAGSEVDSEPTGVNASNSSAKVTGASIEGDFPKIGAPPVDNFNLQKDKIKEVRGISMTIVIVRTESTTGNEITSKLWLVNPDGHTMSVIGSDLSAPAVDYTIGVKDSFIFWISRDLSTLFCYDTITNSLLQKSIPNFGQAKIERAYLSIDSVPWTVVVGLTGLYFYSSTSGEVFSDDDQAIRDRLYVDYNLNVFLTPEELIELKFISG